MKTAELSVSLNEVEALSAKAVRGAGAGWGMAEDTARAVRWMAERNLAWDTPLLGLLASGAVADCLAAVFEVADLLAGAAPGDAWCLEDREFVWVAAILASALHGRDLTVDVGADETAIRLQRDGGASAARPAVFDAPPAGRIAVRVLPGATAPLPHAIPVRAGRGLTTAAVWRELERHAAQTYVLPTLRSRLTGAGGGRVDGD